MTEVCIVHYYAQPGDRVRAGDVVARMVDVFGRPVGSDNGLLRTDYDGFVLGVYAGITFYPNEPIMGLAVQDDGDLVLPLPRSFSGER